MTAATRRRHSRATVFLTVASLVSVAVLLLGIAWPTSPPLRASWRLGDEQRPAGGQPTVAAGTPISVQLTLGFAAHVYVVSWSPLQGTIALFPSARLATEVTNPLAAGEHWLPGMFESKPLTWPLHAVVGPVHYLVVASRVPLPALAETVQRLRQMGHMGKLGAGFTDRAMYVFAPEAGMKVVPSNEAPAAPEFAAARAVAQAQGEGVLRELAGHSGVFGGGFVVQGQ
jgi:hypothetical protein